MSNAKGKVIIMKKLIFVLLDGLTREGAKYNMGYLEHLVEKKQASYVDIKGELPSLSRPCYETIFTGTPTFVHGITANNISRNSKFESIFSAAKKNRLTTGAAAYHWISELYNESPYNPLKHRHINDASQNIQHGSFYFEDSYPDSHLFLDGEFLRKQYNLDLLLIHPMGLDYIGHNYGSKSKEYEAKLVAMDTILANLIPLWVSEHYGIIVTSDHGMSEMGNHGGNRDILRNVPLYFINTGIVCEEKEYSQLSIAPTVCQILDIKVPISMKCEPIKLI